MEQEGCYMCHYSLHHVATRPAKIKDRLVTTKFHNTVTRSLAANNDPRVAVCLMPGTELTFDRDIDRLFDNGSQR
jgi:hypothetical protein